MYQSAMMLFYNSFCVRYLDLGHTKDCECCLKHFQTHVPSVWELWSVVSSWTERPRYQCSIAETNKLSHGIHRIQLNLRNTKGTEPYVPPKSTKPLQDPN